MHKEYPDISDILALKSSGRRQRAALSFAEKLAILDALKERIRPFAAVRQARILGSRRKAPISAEKRRGK